MHRPQTATELAGVCAPGPVSQLLLDCKNILFTGSQLNAADKLVSNNGRWELVYQEDGNLVLFDQGEADWDTQTEGEAPGRVTVENYGELIVYDEEGKQVWSTDTLGKVGPHNRLVLQEDSTKDEKTKT